MNRNLRVIYFAHPRSGSSSLYEILQSHPELNILEEPFNEKFTNWDPGNKNYLDLIHDIPSLDTQVAEIFRTHNGIKILDYQLPMNLAVHMLQRSDCKIIFLRRRNLLQSVVSVLIAEQTGLWKKWEMTKPLADYYRDLKPIDVQGVQKHVKELKRLLDLFETVVDSRTRGDVVKLIYEDLYFSHAWAQKAKVDAIWEMLNIASLALEDYQHYLNPEKTKINSNETYAYLPNASEIQQYCGNDETGWLYE